MAAPLYKVFLAAQPDKAALDLLVPFVHRLKRENRLSGWPMSPDMLHASLNPVYDAFGPPPQAEIDQVIESAKKVRARPFLVTFNCIQNWNGKGAKGPIVLRGDEGVKGLETLHDSIALVMGRAPDLDFKPHISMIWTTEQVLKDYDVAFSWTVREFVLIQSIYGQSRHTVLARFPLHPSPL